MKQNSGTREELTRPLNAAEQALEADLKAVLAKHGVGFVLVGGEVRDDPELLDRESQGMKIAYYLERLIDGHWPRPS